MSYQEQAQGEMWDAIASQDSELEVHSSWLIDGNLIKVCRLDDPHPGPRKYVAVVNGEQLPGTHDWTVDAKNAAFAAAGV